jgi:predicted O-methyltransferase YrrM
MMSQPTVPRRIARETARLIARRLKPRIALRRLRASGAKGVKLADAVEAWLADVGSPAETEWVGRIEALRNRLLVSKRSITVIDYGAGSPDANRSAEQMYEGVKVTTTVDKVSRASKQRNWCLLLLRLVRELEPRSCLEMGTCVGISAAYQAAGLELNGWGRMTTLEGAPEVAALARRSLSELGLDQVDVRAGRFQDILDDTAREREPLDLVFVDGHHDGDATIAYYMELKPHLSAGATLVFDDIHWSPGMRGAWQEITADESVAVSADLGEVGIVSTGD